LFFQLYAVSVEYVILCLSPVMHIKRYIMLFYTEHKYLVLEIFSCFLWWLLHNPAWIDLISCATHFQNNRICTSHILKFTSLNWAW